jgi:hypothetical protein
MPHVSTPYDFEAIQETLLAQFQKEDIISLDDMLNLTF